MGGVVLRVFSTVITLPSGLLLGSKKDIAKNSRNIRTQKNPPFCISDHISRPRPDEWCRSSPISFGPVLLSSHHKRLRGHKQQYRGRYLLLSKPRHAGLYVSGRFGEHSLQSGLRTNVSSSAFAISSRFELKPGEELSFEAILLEC
uniref:Uncharacterized protein n=1 Tax=Cacopsylla melanoneura TaxID=428564 RepID=A0A8D9AK91_9HEMI